jgi:Ser/Thr protein kinase RdoA (MazF antagonist)
MTAELGSLLASGNVAEVFAWGGDQILKLYKPAPWAKRVAFREAANQAAVEAMGLPVPAVHGVVAQSDRWGVLSDRVEGTSFAQRMLADPTLVTGHIEALIDLQLRLQQTTVSFFAGVKQRLANHINHAPQLEPERKDALIAGLLAMPDGDQLCHFDFHPMNVLGAVNSPLVIDWCDACSGTASADGCRSHVLLEIHAEMFAAFYFEHYCRSSRCSADELLAWRPFMLAAKLIETPAEAPRLLALLAATGW